MRDSTLSRKMHPARLLLLLAPLGFTVSGCGDADAGHEFLVRRFRHHYTEGAVRKEPEKLENFNIFQVTLSVLTEGGFTSVPGVAGSRGEIIFSNVPSGTRYLRQLRGSSFVYIVTNVDLVDLSTPALGRADAQPFSGNTASVRLDIDGLEPWSSSNHSLRFVSTDLDVDTSMSSSGVEPGGTQIRGQIAGIGLQAGLPRFEAARGDRAWVNQWTYQGASNPEDGTYSRFDTIVRSLYLPAFSFDGSEPLAVSGTLATPPSRPLKLDARYSAFGALKSEVHPLATIQSSAVHVAAIPHELLNGPAGYQRALGSLLVNHSGGYVRDVIDMPTFGNPYPFSWVVQARVSMNFQVEQPVPGVQAPLRHSTSIQVTDTIGVLGKAPIRPRLRPPGGITIDGMDARGFHSITPASHTIAWQPPPDGVVDAYQLTLNRYSLSLDGSFSRVDTVVFKLGGSFTSLTLPPDVLKSSGYYVVELTALSAPGYRVEEEATFNTLPSDSASTLSGVLKTQ